MFYCKILTCLAIAAAYGLGLWIAPGSALTFVLGIPVCCWAVSLCHELGHFASYRLLGLKWKRLSIFCFVLESEKGFRIDPHQRLFSASCTCVFNASVPYWRYCIALLSGGLTALLLSAGALTMCFFTNGALRTICLGFASLGIANAAVNLLLPFIADRKILQQIQQDNH